MIGKGAEEVGHVTVAIEISVGVGRHGTGIGRREGVVVEIGVGGTQELMQMVWWSKLKKKLLGTQR